MRNGGSSHSPGRPSKHGVAVRVDVVEELPRTGSGKVREAVLRALPVIAPGDGAERSTVGSTRRPGSRRGS